MPSNTFKASQLIAHLRVLMDHHGDLDVVLPAPAADITYAITEKDVVAANRSFGLVYAIAPREPVTEYSRQPDDVQGAWNYDLSQAPEGVTLDVYKRFGGQDTGVRNGDVWSVYEGGDRAWACAPGGVLAWRARA